MRRVRINQGRSVPLTFRLVGTVIIATVCIQVLARLPEPIAIPISIIASILIPVLWFSFHMVTIDNDLKEIHDGIWIMGHRVGKPKPFKQIENIFINKVSVSQTMNTRANTYTTRNYEYRAFIKLDHEDKHFLLSHPSEEKLMKKVEAIREKLELK